MSKSSWTTNLDDYRLIIFDADGTLIDRDSGDYLPGVKEWFRRQRPPRNYAIATNQGGVGLRHWMEKEGFGEPQKYPYEWQVHAKYMRLATDLDAKLFICYAYQSKSSGKWSPTPPGWEGLPKWSREWRKPAPGMLLAAMGWAGVEPAVTLMVGDSEDDEAAARAAGCDFVWAAEFFAS